MTAEDVVGLVVAVALLGHLVLALLFPERSPSLASPERGDPVRTGELGSFWADLVRGVTRILLPGAFVAAIVLVACGAIQNFAGIHAVGQFTGGAQQRNGGAVASREAIKEPGTNGGGYFNADSSHLFENPTPFADLFEIFLLLVVTVLGLDIALRALTERG